MRATALLLLVVACSSSDGGDSALLFFDGDRLASWSGLNLSLGSAHLLSEYHDPTSYTGWGFPSTWRKADGSGWRMMY